MSFKVFTDYDTISSIESRIFTDYDTISDIQSEMKAIEDTITQQKEHIPIPVTDRQTQAFAVVNQAASAQFDYINQGTKKFDLRTYSTGGKTYYPWLFSKTLKHDDNGLTTVEDLDRLIKVSATNGSIESIQDVALSQDPNKTRKLEGIATGNSFWIRGCETQLYDTGPEFLLADSLTNVGEMIEVYEKSLLRDTSFNDIQLETGGDVSRALTSINNYNTLSAYLGPVSSSNTITGQELFRGIGKDELIGPYVSQYLVLPYSYNGISIEQKYQVENDVLETVDYTNYLNIQRGIVGGSPNYAGFSRYAYSGRILGSIVHNDPMYWAYYNACLISKQNGLELEYNGDNVTSAWTDQGTPDLLSAIGEVALGALRVAWNSKFNISLKLRPEAMAQRIDYIQQNIFTGGAFNTNKNNLTPGQQTIDATNTKNGNYLLLLMYPEGSPTHPSFPAGHAVLAGACVTVLKAYIKTHDSNFIPLPWPVDAKHSLDGNSLISYTGSDKSNMTIVGEMNKLASNISLGRDMAGVHYRADGDAGIRVGEKFAIKYLQIKLKEYISQYNGMITSFISKNLMANISK